jgi:hypothetical protein
VVVDPGVELTRRGLIRTGAAAGGASAARNVELLLPAPAFLRG